MQKRQLIKEEMELSMALILLKSMQNRTNCIGQQFIKKIKEDFGYDIKGGANHG